MHKFKILVVDDDLKNIQVGINFLKQNENYHLVFATSGQQALERVQETEFDLVLLDIIMPVMDGYEVCEKLKADPKTKNIPVIFLTAKHEADSLMKGFELGGADYITKPFNAPELNARVKTHLDLHHYYKQEIAKLQELLVCSQKAETIKFIAGGITHDCNNFISSIPPSLHMLQSRLQKNGVDLSPCRDLLEGISGAVSKVSELLSTLSRFSLHADNNPEVVDMNLVIYDLKRVYKGALHHKISLTTKVLSQPAYVLADKLHVEQVLLNMLINAQHAITSREETNGFQGEIALTIDKVAGVKNDKLDSEQEYLCISVKDNGIGMTKDIMQQVFEKYFTTRKELGGTGLGLAVSQSIIHAHAGCITVDSEVGEGTIFQIYLPFCADCTETSS